MADNFDRSTTTAGADEGGPQTGAPVVPSEGRVGTRDSLFLVAQFRLANEQGMREVRVRNLSERGLMLELDTVLAIATPVLLDLRGIGEIGGKVAWCTEGRIGVALDAPIDPKKARIVVGMAKPVNAPRM